MWGLILGVLEGGVILVPRVCGAVVTTVPYVRETKRNGPKIREREKTTYLVATRRRDNGDTDGFSIPF